MQIGTWMESDLMLLDGCVEVLQYFGVRVCLVRGVCHSPDLSACIGFYDTGLICPPCLSPLLQFY